VHRVISMLNSFCAGVIPEGTIDVDVRVRVLAEIEGFEQKMSIFRIEQAVQHTANVLRILNGSIDSMKPWDLNKNQQTAELGNVMRTLAWLIRVVEGMTRPVTPALADRIAALLKLPAITSWSELSSDIPTGHAVAAAEAIYPRLEKKKVDETKAVIEAPPQDEITIDDFLKVKLRVARILDAERVPDSDKLLRLQLVVGEERRQVLAGIAQQYAPEDVIGRQVVVVTNLKPRKMRGHESQGMILAADAADGGAILLMPDKDAPEGTAVH